MSNSGDSINRMARTGARFNDLDAAEEQARTFPGITGLGAAWALAGGEFRDGRPVGKTRELTLAELAKVMKRPTRMLECVDKGRLKKGKARVQGATQASGFYLLGAFEGDGVINTSPDNSPVIPTGNGVSDRVAARGKLSALRESLE